MPQTVFATGAAEDAGDVRDVRSALLEHTSDVILVVSGQGKVLAVTPAITAVLGWDVETVAAGTFFDLVDEADRARAHQNVGRWADVEGSTPNAEYRVRHGDGSTRWLEVTVSNLLEDPAVGGFVIVGRDVTERHQAAERLAAENQVLRQIVNGAPIDEVLGAICLLLEERVGAPMAAMWMVHGERLFLGAAPNVPGAVIAGPKRWSAEHAIAGPFATPTIRVTHPATSQLWDPFRKQSVWDGVVTCWGSAIVDPDGSLLGAANVYFTDEREPNEHDHQVMELATHLAAMAIARDAAGKELAHAASHDALTGLPNRTMFQERLTRVLRRAGDDGQVSVLFIDLDDFKIVNDTAGHAAGDVLLREAAARLADVVRPMDLISRFGGDEFAVLCDGLGWDGASAVADRVLEAMTEPFVVGGRSFQVSASAGIAVGNERTAPEVVLRDADAAMYQAKRAGRGRHAVFTPAAREATVRRLAMIRDLRRDIESGSLSVDYQPIVALDSGLLVGLEALARWRSEEHGVVAPAEFIEVAEQAGLIGDLGAAVLRQAVQRTVAWRHAGVIADDVSIAVNVSAQQLAEPGFVAMVTGTLADAGLPPSALCIELTESVVMADLENAQLTLGRLSALGIALAIDDFGTGHSSLARLRTLEASVLKLDRMFILEIDRGGDPAGVEMVSSIVQLAHALGKRLVVEGVERPGQLHIVRELGADAAQGYLLARPQSPEAMERTLRSTPRWDVQPPDSMD